MIVGWRDLKDYLTPPMLLALALLALALVYLFFGLAYVPLVRERPVLYDLVLFFGSTAWTLAFPVYPLLFAALVGWTFWRVYRRLHQPDAQPDYSSVEDGKWAGLVGLTAVTVMFIAAPLAATPMFIPLDSAQAGGRSYHLTGYGEGSSPEDYREFFLLYACDGILCTPVHVQPVTLDAAATTDPAPALRVVQDTVAIELYGAVIFVYTPG